jgi:hypothetical protein
VVSISNHQLEMGKKEEEEETELSFVSNQALLEKF